ncbi:hypothetical protein HCJ66_02985 [Listeria sp. FSL L7-1582]|uniref:hypothetical protein n=1 Tax=Listeria portnoyi TaxID=2713504 RepID=UPI00164D707A|nr:hypothetical protein [Listeria portnoyi]MBC6308512.1 hypothetical protein [Listeria portnoyi]
MNSINLSDRDRINIAWAEYEDYSKGSKVKIKDIGTIGYVSESINNKKTGEQTYIITPEKLPKNPTPADLEKVQNVTVLYRGSTELMKGDDWVTDWVKNDVPMANQVIGGGQQMPTAQLKSSSQTLKNAMGRYSNASFDIYGHSLGSMNGQYAISDTENPERIRSAYLYEGPNIHTVLNDRQQETAEKLQNRIFNYIDDKDLITVGYSRASTVGMLIRIDSKKTGVMQQHMWGGYQFDKKGNIRIEATAKVGVKMAQTEIAILDQLKNLTVLTGKLRARGGGLSSSEQIYLESSEVLIIAEGIARMVESGFSEIVKACKDAITETEKHWQDTVQRAQEVASHLNYYEVMDALADGGATKASIVDEATTYYEKKIAKAEKLKADYQNLVEEIKTSVTKQLALDKELAKELQIG